MIKQWLEKQPERIRDILDPNWSPVRAAVVLAARHEQEAVKELDEFFSPNPARNPDFWSKEFLGNLVPARCFAPDAGVIPPWRGEQLSEELALATRRADDFEEALTQLEAELASYENPTCNGEWVGGSGGHRKFAGCGLPATWRDDGGACFCDHHLPQNERIAQLESDLAAVKKELADTRTLYINMIEDERAATWENEKGFRRDLATARARLERNTDWYQQRFNRLRVWVNEEVRPLSEETAHSYFAICANGSPSPHESADWKDTLHSRDLLIERLRRELAEARAAMGPLGTPPLPESEVNRG